jgi:cytoskeletal protein RodZ
MTIGSELQQAREQRGLTLVQISERTKIRVPVLRAIERDDFKQLPGGVISRGFVRLFAREVGLDADEIAARFTAEIAPSAPEHAGDGSVAHAGADLAHGATAGTSPYGPRAAAFALAAVALLAGTSYLLKPGPAPTAGTSAVPAESTTPVAVGTSSASAPEATAAATPSPVASGAPSVPSPTAASPAPAPAAKDTSPLRVDLNATDACWISVTSDGEQVAFRSLNQGERLAVRAAREIVLRIGVPGNLVVSINEQRMPPSARPGTPVTLRITPANYRDLLKP